MEYVGPAYLESKLAWWAGSSQTMLHRVTSIDLMNIPLDDVNVLAGFPHLREIKVRAYSPLNWGDSLDHQFADFRVRTEPWGTGGALRYTLTRDGSD